MFVNITEDLKFYKNSKILSSQTRMEGKNKTHKEKSNLLLYLKRKKKFLKIHITFMLWNEISLFFFS